MQNNIIDENIIEYLNLFPEKNKLDSNFAMKKFLIL